MHYYKRNIGDYAKKAGRLSMLQHGAYTLLIDACYDREQFPTYDEAIDWTWASSTEEVEAVAFVLKKFFTLEDGKYIQNHIKEDLATYHKTAETNKRIAKEREEKRRAASTNGEKKSTKRGRRVNEAPPNHKPRTINQEPDSKPPVSPRGEPKLKRKSRLPVDFLLTENMQNRALSYWAKHNRDDLSPVQQFEKFTAHHKAKGSTMADWDSAWTTWYSNAINFDKPRGGQHANSSGTTRVSTVDKQHEAARAYLENLERSGNGSTSHGDIVASYE